MTDRKNGVARILISRMERWLNYLGMSHSSLDNPYTTEVKECHFGMSLFIGICHRTQGNYTRYGVLLFTK